MKMYLMRHGDYASSDLSKALTRKGMEDVRHMAEHLKDLKADIQMIWHSPTRRAQETAQILGEVIECEAFREMEELTPNAIPRRILQEINSSDRDTAVISHLPLIPRLLSELFPDDGISISSVFPTAAVAVIECQENQWSFLEMITVDSI